MLTAPQLAPRNMVLTSPSSNCVQMSYTTVQFPNAPQSQIIYQVSYMYNSFWFTLGLLGGLSIRNGQNRSHFTLSQKK